MTNSHMQPPTTWQALSLTQEVLPLKQSNYHSDDAILTWQYERMEPCLKVKLLVNLQYYVPWVEAQQNFVSIEKDFQSCRIET